MQANGILKSHDKQILTTIFIIVRYYELGIKFSLALIAISVKYIIVCYSGNAHKR